MQTYRIILLGGNPVEGLKERDMLSLLLLMAIEPLHEPWEGFTMDFVTDLPGPSSSVFP